MFKKLITWFFFTILAGVLPIGLKWVICGMAEISFTYSSICAEIFFFNVILSANGLKELYDIDSGKNLKILLFASLIFIIIILSTFYGALLLNDYKDMELSLDNIYLYSKIFTFLCLLVNFSIELLGGIDTND